MNIHRCIAVATTALLLACGSAPNEETAMTSSASTISTAAKIDALKTRIKEIAADNTVRTDNFDEVSAQLFPLVNELAALTPTRTEDETLNLLEGAWHSVWSNLDIGGPGTKIDLTEVYQVVTKDGYYYNLSNSRSLGFLKTVGVLRGAYTREADGFAIEFTRTGYRLGELHGDLMDLTKRIEAGSAPVLFLPAKAPRGPVGITGKLTTLYVDGDLRIAGGSQTPFTSASGDVLVPGKSNLLFVLTRQTSPLP